MLDNTRSSPAATTERQNVSIEINPAEAARLLQGYELMPSRFSPFTKIASPSTSWLSSRPLEEMLEIPKHYYSDSRIKQFLDAAARPDRVLTAVSRGYESSKPPVPYRFYQSSKAGDDFTALHIKSQRDLQILFPYDPEDIIAWMFLCMQYANENPCEVIKIDSLTLSHVLTILALLDCYKQNVATSLAWRTIDPGFQFTANQVKDIIELDNDASDQRWLLPSIRAFFDVLGDRIGAPSSRLLDGMRQTAGLNDALQRIEEYDEISRPEEADLSKYVLNPSLRVMAASLFYWESFVAIHDTQALRSQSGRTEYRENLLAFFSCSAANWVIMSEGLSRDLAADGRFKIFSASAAQLSSLLREFLGATQRRLDEDFYAAEPKMAEVPAASARAAGRIGKPGPQPIEPPPIAAKPLLTVNCRQCGASLPADQQFCEECGARMEVRSAAKPAKKTCARCGQALAPDVKFCDECGEKVN